MDTHCDTLRHLADPGWDFTQCHARGHVDGPRLHAGGITGVFFAVWVPQTQAEGRFAEAARAQIAGFQAAMRRYEPYVAPARTAADVRAAQAPGRLAALLALEGGHLIENSLDVLREFHRHGATYLTLTHGVHTDWADSAGIREPLEPRHGGLTAFGRQVVRELNDLGMMVDVSHVSDATVRDVVEVSRAPIIASHSACRAVAPHCRNLSDELLLAIAGTGGVVQINFSASFVDADPPPVDPADAENWWDDPEAAARIQRGSTATLAQLADHFEHAIQLLGPRHVGIGSDFDGVPALPVGLEDCSRLPALTAELLRRGYSEADLRLILGENALRVMEACARAAGT